MYIQLMHLLAPHLRPQAYLDPGSGSFLIQLLIAGVVGAGFIIKLYWKKIKALFNRSATKEASLNSSEVKKEDDPIAKQ